MGADWQFERDPLTGREIEGVLREQNELADVRGEISDREYGGWLDRFCHDRAEIFLLSEQRLERKAERVPFCTGWFPPCYRRGRTTEVTTRDHG